MQPDCTKCPVAAATVGTHTVTPARHRSTAAGSCPLLWGPSTSPAPQEGQLPQGTSSQCHSHVVLALIARLAPPSLPHSSPCRHRAQARDNSLQEKHPDPHEGMPPNPCTCPQRALLLRRALAQLASQEEGAGAQPANLTLHCWTSRAMTSQRIAVSTPK